MKTNLKTKVMLAVLAGGMLCANGAWAATEWYGKTGNQWTTVKGEAVTSELDLTITDSTKFGDQTIGDLTSSDHIYGGYTLGYDNVTGNSITFDIDNTTTTIAALYIVGGYSDSGNATGNSMIINGGNFSSYIYCGESWNGDANGNSVIIDGGTFGDGWEIYGGNGYYGNASNNTVTINGGTFNGAYIFGGCAGGNATNNTVNINGGTFNNAGIFGGDGSASSCGNILNLKIKIGGTQSWVGGFQTMNFTLPAGITSGETMLSTKKLVADWHNGTATINVYAANGVSLKTGDTITLIDVSKDETPDNLDGARDKYVAGDILGGAGKLVYVVDGAAPVDALNNALPGDVSLKIILEMLQDFSTGGSDQQKAPVEGIAAAMAMVNQSADLASGEGMNSLVAETASGANTFAGMTAGSSKYKTGSHVDVDGWGVLVGAGTTKAWTNGSATTYGLFLEYGKGEFDTYNGAIHGDGDSENKGVGVMARHKLANNTYYEGNIRFGKQETDWSQSEIGGYETDSNYFGISLGIGHVFPVGKNELDVYGRYSYGRVGSSDAQVGSNHYEFDSVNSHRVRVGAKYNFVNENSKAKPFVGLAWEHEFDGEGNATISGAGQAPAPSMKGHTGIMEVGCDWNLSQKWTAGIGANGYIGKRKGWDGMLRAVYNF